MLFNDRYKTIKAPCEGLFRDKGSKFLAYAFPIKTEAECKKIITDLKAEHPKARHHCWALRLSPDRSVFRVNDDGEPSGTAGKPILNTLLSYDVTNVIVVVVRYFGGTLLGVPGLINAYKAATIDALNSAEIVELTVNDIYRVSFDYINLNEVMRISKDFNLLLIHQSFENTCTIEAEIPKMQLNAVLEKLEKIPNLHYNYLSTR